MQCPKCQHQQTNTESCENCGIYFAKYKEIQARQATAAKTHSSAASEGGRPRPLIYLTVAAAVGIGAYSFWPSTSSTETEVVEATIVDETTPQLSDLQSSLLETHAPRNAIEKARNATVFIETSWDTLGSGFIVNDSCHVITNKHVVRFDAEQNLAALLSHPDMEKYLEGSLRALTNAYQRAGMEYMRLRDTYGPNHSQTLAAKEQLQELEASIKRFYAKVEEELRNAVEARAFTTRSEGFDVSLVNGQSYHIIDVTFSEEHDLALFKLPEQGCPKLDLNPDDNIPQGTQLYTIGNPSGLSYTVTSGVFSGYRDQEQQRFLQTDAPINPGNSGGPLISADGRLVGINTFILLDTEGIGFAIPAEVIWGEFSEQLK